MGKVIVEQIVSADGYASYKDCGIGYFDAAAISAMPRTNR